MLDDDLGICDSLGNLDNEFTLIWAANSLIRLVLNGSVDEARMLLGSGVSPNVRSSDGEFEYYTPLGIAVARSDTVMAELLLSYGANVDEPSRLLYQQWKFTRFRPLEILLNRMNEQYKKANLPLLNLLLQHGADVEKIYRWVLSSFKDHGDPAELKLLLKWGFDPDTQLPIRLNPRFSTESRISFLTSVINTNTEMAVQLIQHGAQVNFIDESGKSYLHHSRNINITRLLVVKEVLDLDLRDNNGQMPIELVDVKSAEFLAEQGASIKQLTMHHHQVLASVKLTQRLISAGVAHMNYLNEDGLTPLQRLAFGSCNKAYSKEYTATLKLILEHNQDFDLNQGAGRWGPELLKLTFFVNKWVSKYDDSECLGAIDYLISYGAKPLTDSDAYTPLMYAGPNDVVLNRYLEYEANYYGVEPEIYKAELMALFEGGPVMRPFFNLRIISQEQRDRVVLFWSNIERAQQAYLVLRLNLNSSVIIQSSRSWPCVVESNTIALCNGPTDSSHYSVMHPVVHKPWEALDFKVDCKRMNDRMMYCQGAEIEYIQHDHTPSAGDTKVYEMSTSPVIKDSVVECLIADSVRRGAAYGVLRGASNALFRDHKNRELFYYLNYFTLRWYQYASEDKPMDMRDAYKAGIETAYIFVLSKFIGYLCDTTERIGTTLQKDGQTELGMFVNLSATLGRYGVYAYDACATGVAKVSASIVAGSVVQIATEKLVSSVKRQLGWA